MCGICGILGEAHPRNIEAMILAMRHRGPDDSGVIREEGIALGMTRLAIIDRTANAHQPMSNPEGTIWIVYNGETYNFREEREVLLKKGCSFKSASDTEVVLRMYEEYGDDFLIRMRGMFALAIYDKRQGPHRKRLLLARDPLGVKPLLYAHVGSRLMFASEMKALLTSGLIERKFEPEALRLLMTYGSITQPMSSVAGVRMLLPGHRLIVEPGSERMERFWKLERDRVEGLRTKPYHVQVDTVRSFLQESVRLQMVSDVPIGAFLSGGVDSSLLVALMSQISGARVKTFSVGFEQEGADIDETDDAGRVANLLGTNHSRVVVTGEDFRDKVKHIASALDQPSVDGVNSYFISMAARKAVTVAVSGTGGDEFFAGYPWFRNMATAYNVNGKRGPLGSTMDLISKAARADAFNFIMGTCFGDTLDRVRGKSGFVARYARQHQIFGSRGACRILAPEMKRKASMGLDPFHELGPSDELPSGSAIDRTSALCLRNYTQNQLLRDIDAVSMAHSLEVRVPFLDKIIADMAFSLPDHTKLGDSPVLSQVKNVTYRESGSKRILIDAGRPFLPEGMDLQGKRGFGMPFDAWLRTSLIDVLDDTLSPKSVKRRGYFDAREVSSLRMQFLKGEISWVFPWILIITELWCREVLDRIACDVGSQMILVRDGSERSITR